MKDTKTESVSVRIDKELKKKLREKAEKERRSLSNLVCMMLEREVKNV